MVIRLPRNSAQLDRTVENPSKVKRAAAAAIFGTSLEYYEFYIYGSAAALIFPKIFFPSSNAFISTLLSLASLAIVFVVRPFAAAILGNYGDQIGRKKLLMFTLVLMGGATFVIGCLPTYESVGVLAPILLIILRILQGIAIAGEQAGASALTLEHAPPGRRAFFASFTPAGTAAGFLLATAAFGIVVLLPDDMLFSWGWRIPFWASVVIVLLAFFIRRKVEEPEVFIEAQEAVLECPAKKEPSPIGRLFREHPRTLLRVTGMAMFTILFQIPPVFALAFATSEEVGISRTAMLWTSVAGFAVALCMYPLFGEISDRIGRKPVFVSAVLLGGVLIFPYFSAIMSGNIVLILVASIALNGLVAVATNAVWPSMFAECFNVKVRFTGVAISMQVGTAIAGFMPTIGWILVGDGGSNWMPVALITLGFCVIAAISALIGPETFNVPTEKLGEPADDRVEKQESVPAMV